MLAVYNRNRFGALFATLLLALAAGPTLESITPLYNPLEWLLAPSLLAAIVSVVLEGSRVPDCRRVAFVVVRVLRAVFDAPGLLPSAKGSGSSAPCSRSSSPPATRSAAAAWTRAHLRGAGRVSPGRLSLRLTYWTLHR
jgi:hypothetical protein